MVVSLNHGNFGIEVFHFLWFNIPTATCDPGDQLVVVALFAPLLDSFLVRLAIQHEGIQWSGCFAFMLLADFLVTFIVWSVGPRHHVTNWHIIVSGLDAQRLPQIDFRWLLFAFLVPLGSR